jgi:hypothetical protein
MIRRFTSAQFVPASAGAKAKNLVGSTLFSTPMIALLRHSGHKILRTCCRESARKRVIAHITLMLQTVKSKVESIARKHAIIRHSPDTRGFAASVARFTGFGNGKSPSCQ